MFNVDVWIQSQTEFESHYVCLGAKSARVSYLTTGDPFKVKWANSELDLHFLKQEAIWMRRLFRQNVVVEKCCFQDNAFFLFSFWPGDDLAFLLKSHRAEKKELDRKWARTIALSLFNRITELHLFGVVHADLKPQNMLFHEDKIRLIDYGSAGWKGSSLSVKGVFSHTKSYSLPDIIRYNQYHTDFDWYAFFVILNQLYGAISEPFIMASADYFTQQCLLLLDIYNPDSKDRYFLENVILSIAKNKRV